MPVASTVASSQRKTNPKLLRTVFALAKQWKLSETDVRELNLETNGTRRLSRMTDAQAERLIARLGGRQSLAQQPIAQPTNKQGKPLARRTTQHHRQTAGIVQTKTEAHLILLCETATKCGMTDAQLQTFNIGQIGVPMPRTTKETNKCLEPLKAMYKRGWRASQVTESEAA